MDQHEKGPKMRMKILYIEDEIVKHRDKIKRLFSRYLDDELMNELNKIEEDEYGASAEEVKKIIDKSNFIDLEYSFQGAIDKIINKHEDYCLFIVDRNLSEVNYGINDIKGIDDTFSESLFDRFKEREGDYLLEKLVYEKVDVLNRFYFLTAYSVSELPNKEEISKHIDFSKFRAENIIEKSNRIQEQKLISIINNAEVMNLHLENQIYIDVLRTELDRKGSSHTTLKFVELLKNQNDNDRNEIEMNLGNIRNITENILTYIAKKFHAPERCYSGRNKNLISFRDVIFWLAHDEKKEEKYNLNSNVMIKNYLYNIISICSEFGVHSGNSRSMGFLPTSNTVQALVSELKEIILWVRSITK